MSSTIPILSALLLTLMLGSAEGGQRMDPVALLRQTLRYWWKIYKTYEEEVALGYCWADYLLGISDRLSANLSVSSHAATTGDYCSNASVVVHRATKSQQNPFPPYVMADAATTTLGETRRKRHSQEKRSRATTRTVAVSEFIRDNLDERQTIISRLKLIREQGNGEIMNRAERGLRSTSNKLKEDETDERKKIISDPYTERRRRASAIGSELLHREDSTERVREFSSRGASSRAVNPTPGPRDNDEAGFGSTSDDSEGDTRRKLLRSPTSDRDSFVENALGRSFSLRVGRGRRRKSLVGNHRGFPFRRFLSPRDRENPSGVDVSFDPRTSSNRGTTRDPTRRVPSNKSGSHSARSLRRRLLAQTSANTIVKPMNSKRNSPGDPAVGRTNSRTRRVRKAGEFRDSPREVERELLLVDDERSRLESGPSGGKAVERIALAETVGGGSNTEKRRYPRSWKEERPRLGKDVSSIHPFLSSSRLERLRRQMPRENRRSFFVVVSPSAISEESKQNGTFVREGASLLSRVIRFPNDYRDHSLSQSMIHNSRPSALKVSHDRNELSNVQQPSLLSSIYLTIAITFRTLAMFVQVGRQIMNVVESNTAFACTREYLWTQFLRWIV